MPDKTIRQRVGDFITGRKTSGGGANWFLNFLQIAEEEDSAAGGVTIANAYKTVAWVNIAISSRARNLARAPFKLYSGDTEVEDGPVYELFRKHGAALWESTEGWRCIRGEAIWILNWGGAARVLGIPQQIVVVDPSMMEAKLDPTGTKVMLWVYNGTQKIPFKPEEVVHFPMWNPYDMVRSLPELTPVLNELNQEYLMSRGTAKLLNNQSIPGGIITIPGDEMTEEQAQKVIEKWEKKHRGINRAGRVAVLGSGATYQKISLSPEEMQSSEMRNWNRETVLAKYGVPLAVVGLQNGGTLSGKDTAEQMKAFWNLTLIPECRFFEAKVKDEMFARFGIDLECEFDTSSLWEMQTDEETLSNRLRMDVSAGVLTINEAREMRGMDPVDWGDTWWKSMGLVDVMEEPEPVPDALAPFAGQNNPPKEDEEDEEEEEPEEEEDKSVGGLFNVTKSRRALYTPEYLDYSWKAQFNPAEAIEAKYAKALKSEFYKMRQDQMHRLMSYGGQAAVQQAVVDELAREELWEQYAKRLEFLSRPYLIAGIELTQKELQGLFNDLGLDVGISWDIWDAHAKELMERRLITIKGVVDQTQRGGIRDTLSAAIENGWSVDETADVLRDKWNIPQNRAPTIARTEIAAVINESRVEGFREIGVQKHQWLTARDVFVRGRDPGDQYDHVSSEGAVRSIGDTFPCGLTMPHDPAGDPGNVINCRCDTLPVFEE